MVSYLARRDATVADGGRRRDAPPTPTATCTCPADLPWPRDTETVVADRRVPESWLEVNDRTRRRPDPADRPPVPPGPGHRGRLRSRRVGGGRHRGGVHPGRVPVLPALRRLLRAAARQRLRQAGHPRPGGPVVGHDADLHVDRPVAAGHPRGGARRQRAQAPHLRRQPAGRGAAGRALQRLHRGHHGPRRALPRGGQGGGRRRGGPVLRRHPGQGHPRARPRPGRLRHAPRRGPGAAQAHRSRAARRGEPAGVPRPGARLAGHDAQPGAGRPDPGRLPGPGRRRGQGRAVAGLLPRAAGRRAGSPRAGLPRAARRDAQVPGDRRRVLRAATSSTA